MPVAGRLLAFAQRPPQHAALPGAQRQRSAAERDLEGALLVTPGPKERRRALEVWAQRRVGRWRVVGRRGVSARRWVNLRVGGRGLRHRRRGARSGSAQQREDLEQLVAEPREPLRLVGLAARDHFLNRLAQPLCVARGHVARRGKPLPDLVGLFNLLRVACGLEHGGHSQVKACTQGDPGLRVGPIGGWAAQDRPGRLALLRGESQGNRI